MMSPGFFQRMRHTSCCARIARTECLVFVAHSLFEANDTQHDREADSARVVRNVRTLDLRLELLGVQFLGILCVDVN